MAVLTATGAQQSAAGIDVARALPEPPADWTGMDAPIQGIVLIPDHIDPTNPRRVYDLEDGSERKYLYEVVLTDGTDVDINRLIAGAALVELWDRLYLPGAVRSAWADTLDALRTAEHDGAPRTATGPNDTLVGAVRTSSQAIDRGQPAHPGSAMPYDVVYGNTGCGA